MRDEYKKLTELIEAARWSKLGRNLDAKQSDEFIADYLIANGVVFKKTGRWIKEEDIESEYYGWYCSECGSIRIERTPYCEYCGADMRGEEHETD